ncbi:MAG: hypothetical protein ABSA08_00760 [Acidimicrobiales bacterium]|jgi:hypothetical protein
MRAFSPRLYRDAVALVTAADGEDLESFETILADVGAPVARPLADMLVGALRLYADSIGEDFATTLARVGMFAAEQSAGSS